MDERSIKITLKEYIVNTPDDDIKLSMELYSNHYLPTIKPHTIFYKNKTINDENKYNEIIKIIDSSIETIMKLNMENISSFKGGLQEIINIQIDNNNYLVIGNTDNQEMKQLYNKIKENINRILNDSNDSTNYLFEQDDKGAFIRLIIPADFVSKILSPDKSDDMDLRGKKNQDLTTDEVIVLKKYAYELSENIKSNKSYYKQNESDKIWWIENPDSVGEHLFTFDKEKIFNLFKDYPHELTPEQKEIFDKENPYWANFFKDRQ